MRLSARELPFPEKYMTLTFKRAAIALAIAVALVGCGGKASFQIAGTVVGLSNQGLVLTTNGMDVAVPATATSFTFPNTLSYGDVYNVTVKAQPEHQTCSVGSFVSPTGVTLNGASDTAGRLASINIGVQCSFNTFGIGGKVTGLTSAGLVLTNGSFGGTVTITPAAAGAADPTFVFPNPVQFGVSYGVTVLTQPASETCSVSPNGTGVMGDVGVGDIVVSCVPKT
jgi:RNase P/RNase MRP subunit p29